MGGRPETDVPISSKNRPRRPRRPRPPTPPRPIEAIPYTLPDGRSVLYIGESVLESDPPAVRDGIARRRILFTEGRCPCGAATPFDPSVIAPGLIMSAVVHGHDCPASDANLWAAMRRGAR